MKLLVVNGSPRGCNSNSLMITKWMFEETNFDYNVVNTTDISKGKKDIRSLFGYDTFFIIFPLYVDSVPAVTKYVFEQMQMHKNNFKNKNVYFCVHSGFPEAVHSRAVEKYLEYFASLLGMNFKSTVVIGGSEAIRVAPPQYFKKRIELLHQLGHQVLNLESFSSDILLKINKFEKLPKIMTHLGKLSPPFYWNSQLKKNNAFDKRFERPYK